MNREESLYRFEQHLQRRFPQRRTSIDYLSDLRQFCVFCSKEWRAVTLHDIDAFVLQQHQQGLQPATINRRVAALKTFFDFVAEDTGDLSWPNPVRFKRHASKPARHLPRDLREADLAQLWNQIPQPRDRAWFVFMVRAGLRVGEVVGLRLADLLSAPDGERPAQVRVKGKGDKERIVLLGAQAYEVLQTWLAVRPDTQNPFIFLNQRGQPLTVSGIQWLLHGYAQAVGLKVTPHQLRHTFARQLTEAGMPLPSLSKLLGHAHIATTQIYTAGADPALAQAYQAAMQHLERPAEPPLPPPLFPFPVAPLPAPDPPAPASGSLPLPEPLAPDWEGWALDLPPAIRQACLTYGQQRYPRWPARTRRSRALNLLSEMKGIWGWLVQNRGINEPGQVRLKDLWAYQTDQQAHGYAAGTINRRTDYVLGITRQLADQEAPHDPSVFRLRYLPRPQSLPKSLTAAESQRLEAYLQQDPPQPDPHHPLRVACLWLLLHSGLRSGECVALQGQDLDLAGKRLIVRQGKGRRDRLVYLSEATCQALQTYLQAHPAPSHGPLWRYANGQPMRQGWLADQVAAVGQAIGVEKLYPHRLRHTCATRWLNAGLDITHIQKLLGHEQLSTTQIYAKVWDATLEADYHLAQRKLDQQQRPVSDPAIAVADWPISVTNKQELLDNSV